MDNAWSTVLTVTLIILSIYILLSVFRAIKGPGIVDRLLSVNMVTTLVSICVCVLALLLGEDFLVDVGLIFSLLGGISVVVLSKVFGDKPKSEKEALKQKRKKGL